MFLRLPIAAFCAALVSLPASGVAATSTVTNALSATISPLASISSTSPASPFALALSNSGSTTFTGPFTNSITLNYFARTTSTGSGGTITLKVTSDFTPTGGPSVASGNLTYTCGAAGLGTACSSTTASTSATGVLTIPTSSCNCSATTANSVSVTFSLVDVATYATGNYSAGVTFTISAT